MAIPCLGSAGACALHAASSSVASSAGGGIGEVGASGELGASGASGASGGGASAVRELADAFDRAMAGHSEQSPADGAGAGANPALTGPHSAGPHAAGAADPAAVPGADAAGPAIMSPTELLKIQYTVSMLSSDAGGSAEFSKHISEDVEALLKQKD